MKKKIWKKVLIGVLIILVILLLNIIRKTVILYKIAEKNIEYSECKNYYKKIEYPRENATVELWRKGDLAIFKRMTEEGTRMIYYGDGYSYIIIDGIDSEGNVTKKAVKMTTDNVLFLPVLNTSIFSTKEIWTMIKFSCVSMITTENLDGVECYKVYAGKDYIIYSNKENGLDKKVINGTIDMNIVDYRLNDVTDEEIALPNLDGFEISEQN